MLETTAVDRFDGLKKSTAQLRSECASFQGFVVDTLDQLEQMRVKLAEREGRVQFEYKRLDEQREAVTRLRDHLDQSRDDSSDLEKTILELRAELDETKEALDAQRQHAERNERENRESCELLETLRHDLEVSESQRQQLSAERDKGRQDSEGYAEAISQLEETRQQLEETRQELDATRTQWSEARKELKQARDSSYAVEPERFKELEEERAALEAELEQARHRAAELANAVAKQKQQLAEERTGWTDELNELRSLKDMHAPVSIAASASPSAPEPASKSSRAGIGSSDPVVGSVLAQFAQLQKDAASRRSEPSE